MLVNDLGLRGLKLLLEYGDAKPRQRAEVVRDIEVPLYADNADDALRTCFSKEYTSSKRNKKEKEFKNYVDERRKEKEKAPHGEEFADWISKKYSEQQSAKIKPAPKLPFWDSSEEKLLVRQGAGI